MKRHLPSTFHLSRLYDRKCQYNLIFSIKIYPSSLYSYADLKNFILAYNVAYFKKELEQKGVKVDFMSNVASN